MELLLLDYTLRVLEHVECVLAALAFLKCELVENPRMEFRKQLEVYPQLLLAVEAMPIDWDMRNRFLTQISSPIANEALIWCFGWKVAHDEAHRYWLKFLESLETLGQ